VEYNVGGSPNEYTITSLNICFIIYIKLESLLYVLSAGSFYILFGLDLYNKELF